MNLGSIGTDEKPAVQYFILFDPSNGHIRHVHSVVTLPGARGRSIEEHEVEAKKIAANRIADVGKLQVLRWSGAEAPTPHKRVDVETLKLVSV